MSKRSVVATSPSGYVELVGFLRLSALGVDALSEDAHDLARAADVVAEKVRTGQAHLGDDTDDEIVARAEQVLYEAGLAESAFEAFNAAIDNPKKHDDLPAMLFDNQRAAFFLGLAVGRRLGS